MTWRKTRWNPSYTSRKLSFQQYSFLRDQSRKNSILPCNRRCCRPRYIFQRGMHLRYKSALQRKTKLFLNHTLNFHILCCIRGCCPKSGDHRLVSKHLQDRYKDYPLDNSIILYRDNYFLWISTVLRFHRTRAFCRPTTSRQLQDPDLRSRHRVSRFVYLCSSVGIRERE